MPWLEPLRAGSARRGHDRAGAGPALPDKAFLRLTIALYDSIIRQVHAALEKGAVRLEQVQAAAKLDEIRQQFTRGDATLNARFDWA